MKTKPLIPLLALLALLAGPAQGERFLLIPGEPNSVRFVSKAPLETVQGRTRQVKGEIIANLGRLADSVQVTVEVDLASLDTGIALRNQHMREDHLETAKYPAAIFRGRHLLDPSQAALALGQRVTFRLAGDFTLHGTTLPVEIPLEVTYAQVKGQPVLKVMGQFPILLSDYKIARPQFLMMRLDNTQQVTVELVAVPPS